MKQVLNKLPFLMAVVMFTFSCEDYLDVSPDLGIGDEEVWPDYFATRSVLDRAYRLINNPKYANADWEAEFGSKSDECQAVKLGNPMNATFNSGNWFDQNWRDLGGMTFLTRDQEFGDARDRFGNAADKGMYAIRALNLLLENIDRLEVYPDETGFTNQELKDQLIGQAYYLRAFHYFQIIRRYGPMPILDRVLSSDSEFDITRPTYLECTDFMVEDLDNAIALLPARWTGPNYGRGSQSSARALKAMVLLYAASPLMNPQLNPFGSNGEQYNTTYASAAVDAAVEAINGYAAGGYVMHTWADYTENWHSRTLTFSPESLIVAPHSPATDPTGQANYGSGWFHPQMMGGWGSCNHPTQNAVDWYETASGYPIDDPDAQTLGGYDPTDPYNNRDPRLRVNVWVHGDDMFEGLTSGPGAVRRVIDVTPGGFHNNQEFNGWNNAWTGYYHKYKHSWPGNDRWNLSTGRFVYMPYIRVAQTYLDLAEAATVVYGPNGAIPGTGLTAVSALNVVRNRAQMPDVLAKFTTDADTFMARVRNERAVELYFEEHRWYDLKRWHKAVEVLGNGEIYGADIREVGGVLVYDKKVVDGAQRVFEDKHYWYPFPSAVMNNFSTFEQNPGW